jgi:magnesium transporter
VTWINVSGIHKIKVIEELGKCFSLHPLLLEDILNTDQRPKMEEYEGYLFIVLKMMYYGAKNEVTYEQISLVLGRDMLPALKDGASS